MSDIITPEQAHTLIASAIRDAAFRQSLLANPHAAVQHQLGVEVPSGKTLHVGQGMSGLSQSSFHSGRQTGPPTSRQKRRSSG